jgi:sugar phosphate isomerase/epimerase
MRVSISNIAWSVDEDSDVVTLLKRRGIHAIDVAPGKYFPDPHKADDQAIHAVRVWWRIHGIHVTGMQALLFGTTGLNLFGDEEVQKAMLHHLRAICRIANGLGAKHLVFGSPRNRDRSGLNDAQTERIAKKFFRNLGTIAGDCEVIICLEPNPASYGCNFMTQTDEAAHIVRLVDHPAIRLQLDSGALTINQEDPMRVLAMHGDIIAHVHASEPNLVTLGEGGTDHAAVAAALERHGRGQTVTIEMVASDKEPHLHAIERAVDIALRHYAKDSGRSGDSPC